MMFETFTEFPVSISALTRDYLPPAYDGPFGTLLGHPPRVYTDLDIFELFATELENGNEEYLKSYVENFQAAQGKRLEIATLSRERFFINIDKDTWSRKQIRDAMIKRMSLRCGRNPHIPLSPLSFGEGRLEFPSRILWFLDNPSVSVEPFYRPKNELQDILIGQSPTRDDRSSILIFHSLKAETSLTFFWFRDFADQLRIESERGEWITPDDLKDSMELALHLFTNGNREPIELSRRKSRIIQAAKAGHLEAVRAFIANRKLSHMEAEDLISDLSWHGLDYVSDILHSYLNGNLHQSEFKLAHRSGLPYDRHVYLKYLIARSYVPDNVINYAFEESYIQDREKVPIISLVEGGRELAFFDRMAKGEDVKLSVILQHVVHRMECNCKGQILQYLLEVLDGSRCRICRGRDLSGKSTIKFCNGCSATTESLDEFEKLILSCKTPIDKICGSQILRIGEFYLKHGLGRCIAGGVIARGVLLREEECLGQYIDILLDAPDQKGREEQVFSSLEKFDLLNSDYHWLFGRRQMERFVLEVDVGDLISDMFALNASRIQSSLLDYLLSVPSRQKETESALRALSPKSTAVLAEIGENRRCPRIFALSSILYRVGYVKKIMRIVSSIDDSNIAFKNGFHVLLADHVLSSEILPIDALSYKEFSWDDISNEWEDKSKIYSTSKLYNPKLKVPDVIFGTNPWYEFLDSLSDPRTQEGKRNKKSYDKLRGRRDKD